MGVLTNIQIYLLALGGVICFLIALFTKIVEYKIPRRKRALLIMESATSLLLFSDMFSYIYYGKLSTLAIWIVRISNFLLFFLLYLELLGFYMYVKTFFKKTERKGFGLEKAIECVLAVGMLLVIVAEFFGWYYTIDRTNNYVRGPLFMLSFVAPFMLLLMSLFLVITKKNEMPRLIYISALIFVISPIVSAVVQILVYGLSLINLTMGITAIIIFALSLIEQNNYLKIVATTEKLTGLYNSYGYVLELEKICSMGKITEYDAYYFDIIRMGLINRKYGNEVGDYVIKSYTKALSSHLQEDEVLGRLGGNFFVALVKKENSEAFIQLLKGVDIPLEELGSKDCVRVSSIAGIYQITDKNTTPDLIMANVSMAVNIAKNVKKTQFVTVTPELIEEMDELRQMQELIPISMAQREFVAFYQPKVDLKMNKLCGAEALCRWKHDGALVPPYRFIPIMEQNESICKLDFYMLHRVCEDIKKWLEEGLEVPVISVNFSRKNLGNPILAEEIYNVVKSYDIPISLIQIEITETNDEYPFEYLKGVVEALHRYGLTSAIDDFGVGGSSLRLLKDIPFDVLKIDKSFVDSLTEMDCKFLKHIIEMAHEVGASVITEGVETEEQIRVLKELNCGEIQGYYFDKPLPIDAFEERLHHPFYV